MAGLLRIALRGAVAYHLTGQCPEEYFHWDDEDCCVLLDRLTRSCKRPFWVSDAAVSMAVNFCEERTR